MKKNPKKTLIIIGVLLLIILNVCIGITLINNDKKKEDTNNDKNIVSPDTPQVGAGTPSAGEENARVGKYEIYYRDYVISFDSEIVNGKFSTPSHGLKSINDIIAKKLVKKNYTFIKCFNFSPKDNNYPDVTIKFNISRISDDPAVSADTESFRKAIELYVHTDNRLVEVKEKEEGEHDKYIKYDMDFTKQYCFFLNNNKSNSY